MRPAKQRDLVHPGKLMFAFWLLVYAVYLAAPIHQEPAVSVAGLLFVWGLLTLFYVGTVLGAASVIRRSTPAILTARPFSDLARQTGLVLSVGIVGAVLSLSEKLASIELFDLLGAAELRAERAQELLAAVQLTSPLLSGLGFLCYPAGFVGLVATMVSYETQSKSVRLLALTYISILFALTIVSGGRSTILVLIIFIGLAAYVRRYRGLPIIPRSTRLRYLLSALCILFVAYSTAIWQVRSSLNEGSHDAFFEHAELVWGVAPTKTLEDIGLALGGPSSTQSIMSTIFYFTQSVSIVERILTMSEVPVMLGAYHIDIVAAAMRAYPAATDFLADGYSELLDANVYGFFAGAWGALFIDFGLFGAAFGAVVWGWLAGRSFREARSDTEGRPTVMYVFWMYSVLISFVSPPLGFANSAITLFWFVVYCWIGDRLTWRRPLRTAKPSSTSVASAK